MGFLLVVAMYGLPLAFIFIVIIVVSKFFKVDSYKHGNAYLKSTLLLINVIYFVGVFLPMEAHYALSEYRLEPILQRETTLNETINYLDKWNIKYHITDAERCKELGKTYKLCADIPYITVHFPMFFTLMEGMIQVRIIFNDNNQFKKHYVSHGFTFL